MATGAGLAHVVGEALEQRGLDLSKRRVSIQGFGNVGSWAALLLDRLGVTIVAVGEIDRALVNEGGLDIPQMVQNRLAGLPLDDDIAAEVTPPHELFDVFSD